jgi:hypothetical protein
MTSGDAVSAFGAFMVFAAIARTRINVTIVAVNLAFEFTLHDNITLCTTMPKRIRGKEGFICLDG